MAGDPETGVMIFQMEPSLDTGPVLATARVPITAQSTAASLHDTLADVAAGMVVDVIEDLAAGRAHPVPQPDEGVTYAAKIGKADGRLDWSQPADVLERQLRALNPWPGCWTEASGQILRVLAGEIVPCGGGTPGEILDEHLTVACGRGCLRITRLQRPGGKPLDTAAFLRGFTLPAGSRLGTPCPATS
jgi:methionyl-tRNA formyltransferase